MKLIRAASLPLAIALAGCVDLVHLGDIPVGSTGSTADPDTGELPTTTAGSTTGKPGDTTQGLDSDDGSGSTAEAPTTGTSATGTTDDGTTDGPAVDCSPVSQGPWSLEPWLMDHDAGLDLGFDGHGNFAVQQFTSLVVVSADTNEYVLVPEILMIEGMRYLADGRLLVAHTNDLHVIDPQGFAKSFIVNSGFTHPTRLQPDHAGNVWLVDDPRLVRIAPDLTLTTLYDSSPRPRDMIYDEQRRVVFFTTYPGTPVIQRLPVAEDGTPGQAVTIYEDKDTSHSLNAFALDVCGNLYFVVYGNLKRLLLDPEGLSGELQDLLFVGNEVTSLNFATGPGFDPHTLLITTHGGGIRRMTLEFPGAPIVTVE